ncbi:MAG: hypothetical protein IT275_03635 [Chitinophagales bacterium]|nr:hypothetical protein [Chitinophagales bacterium]HMV15241.1 hypothetical protein [Chitinophagales bacterium]HMW13690.1 hypothetical protein [Chitinophagales bacterium]HMX61217.1 hypothetical protein [Chitinophagales bacterium]HMY23779.1 hypothetical protein [Chitinophagales bacterium]
MNKLTKSLLAVAFAGFILSLSSCTASHRGTGCPAWSKAKQEQINKKNV